MTPQVPPEEALDAGTGTAPGIGNAHMVIVAGHVTVEPQQRESYLSGCVAIVEQAREAAGCLDIAITADLVAPGRVDIFERCASGPRGLPPLRSPLRAGRDDPVGVGGRVRRRRRAAPVRPDAPGGSHTMKLITTTFLRRRGRAGHRPAR